MIDSLIFDVDGTIWDTTPVVEKAWNAALDECGLSYAHVTADTLKSLFGLPMKVIIERILPNEPDEVRAKFKPLCYNYEESYVERESGKLYPKMAETLEKLAEKYPLFIVSNCQSGYIELLLRKTGFAPYFKDFTCNGDTGLLKDENIKLIAKRNGLKSPVYVGDTQGDADACAKAGVPIVYASYGFGKVKSPDYTIAEPFDLIRLFCN
ncbi:MAG: HAD family hydrolase [Spirochaetaceae bacterium]|nr:HAD family hydrolase [Spirochaetaceae bacterium]